MSPRSQDAGVVLVNVLVVLAIAGGLMLVLISTQGAATDRVLRAADAAVVEQIAFGAEASVVDALRRDLDDGPETDHLNEPWALGVIQNEVVLPTGEFSVQVTDLQAKFDINQLADANAGTQAFAQRLMIALDQPPQIANQIIRILAFTGPVGSLDDLLSFGVAPEALAAMRPYVTALPVQGTVNLNSVDPFLLGVMLQNRSQASQLIRLREGRGSLTLEDLSRANVLRPQNSGLISNAYSVDILAQAGDAEIRLQSTIVRSTERGAKTVEITGRRFVYEQPDSAEQ
ncbi:type II secretion system minor pseudopilin [Sulfitobacter guttiformis]|uniref:Type II secretion system protein K n=1 Tax=Sulfitobacter guttiformis TaxID=74349 RepID=A0A420DTR7_9RHOB|nr:type II secretion system protein GspK [Sulfitobacter guttiformis]KIN71055.1 general secretion pathway protein K [Sulfitobacter guttiformis KCTC 32187]RKE97539.1 general secretion pathway protein K [Sulfitobacter guttiformis]